MAALGWLINLDFAASGVTAAIPDVVEDTGGWYQRIHKQKRRKVKRVEDAYREILLARKALEITNIPIDTVPRGTVDRYETAIATLRQEIDSITDVSDRIVAVLQAEQLNKDLERTLSALAQQEVQARLADTLENDLLLMLTVV